MSRSPATTTHPPVRRNLAYRPVAYRVCGMGPGGRVLDHFGRVLRRGMHDPGYLQVAAAGIRQLGHRAPDDPVHYELRRR